MKGIILAAGTGTRLAPITKAISKHLLPIYDKPMIFYPLSVLMLSGIKEILIITDKDNEFAYKKILGDGSQLGMKFVYLVQRKANGIAEAFIIGEQFIDRQNICLILGDNFFFGQNFKSLLIKSISQIKGATLFIQKVKDPRDFGVVKLNKNNKIIKIIEKPKEISNNHVITGLYIYDKNVVEISKSIKPSKRNELEISSINKIYLKENNIKFEILGRGFTWLDMGTYKSFRDASFFVETMESRQGYKIGCLEEIAFDNGWITKNQLKILAKSYKNNDYGKYLQNICEINKIS